MDRKILPAQHTITEDDIKEVVGVLRGEVLTQGEKLLAFEKAFAQYVGSKYAVGVSSGTAALHLSVLVLSLQQGEKVITTPISYIATGNCIEYCGGETVFADIDPSTFQLDIKQVEKLLQAEPLGTYSGIIPVDFSGRALDLAAFKELAQQYNLWVIEDACHALGGYFQNSKTTSHFCGDGQSSNLAVFSFYPSKHITTGEGGMITTNDEMLYSKLLKLRSHGIPKETRLNDNTFEVANKVTRDCSTDDTYEGIDKLGYNYRLTELQAALGISQLKRADFNLGQRRIIAKRYFDALCNISQITNQSGIIKGHAYYLYIIQTEYSSNLKKHLKEHNIFTKTHYPPIHQIPYYQNQGYKSGDFPNAENYYKSSVSLPMYPSLSVSEQTFVIQTIVDFFS